MQLAFQLVSKLRSSLQMLHLQLLVLPLLWLLQLQQWQTHSQSQLPSTMLWYSITTTITTILATGLSHLLQYKGRNVVTPRTTTPRCLWLSSGRVPTLRVW